MRRTLIATIVVLFMLGIASPVGAGTNRNFVSPLDGGQEVPPVDTNGTGVARFKVSKDGSSVGFKLIVANLQDVFAAHIHCAPVGVNGPIGVTLFMGAADGRVNGILSQGTIEEPDPGNACAWEDLDDVVAALHSGDTYVNVHTPDVPGGEIRGQVR